VRARSVRGSRYSPCVGHPERIGLDQFPRRGLELLYLVVDWWAGWFPSGGNRGGMVLPSIRPTVLGTIAIEVVVVVCAVRCAGPVYVRQPPSSSWVMLLRGACLDQSPRRGLEFRRSTRGCRGVPVFGL